ncbi:hypothetical protein XENOCAPTIV_000919, partial [Xenoophorus captivus]
GRYVWDLACATGVVVLGWFVTLMSVLIVALLITLLGHSMFWYTHFYAAICLYGAAATGKIILIQTLAKNLYYGVSLFSESFLSDSKGSIQNQTACTFSEHLGCGLVQQAVLSVVCLPHRVYVWWSWAVCILTSACCCGAAAWCGSPSGACGQVESRDSGIWINSFDFTAVQHITPHIPEINDSIRTRCREDRPFCGYPWFLPVKFLSRSE